MGWRAVLFALDFFCWPPRFLVDGAVNIAARLRHFRGVFIGTIFVAVAPRCRACEPRLDRGVRSVGNRLGQHRRPPNIFNVAGHPGVTAMITRSRVSGRFCRFDLPIMICAVRFGFCRAAFLTRPVIGRGVGMAMLGGATSPMSGRPRHDKRIDARCEKARVDPVAASRCAGACAVRSAVGSCGQHGGESGPPAQSQVELALGECPTFCVWLIGSMLPVRSNDDDDWNHLLDELLKGCKRPEDLLGDTGLMKEPKLRLMDGMLGAELVAHLAMRP